MALINEVWMKKAISLASEAASNGEVPVGAIIVRNDKIIGRGSNRPITFKDPTAHAEIVAIRDAALKEGNYRLPGTTLYVTIEPCTMCVGAMIHARIDHVVFGAREPRAGALISNLQLDKQAFYNHRLKFTEGILSEECGRLMSDFFNARRSG